MVFNYSKLYISIKWFPMRMPISRLGCSGENIMILMIRITFLASYFINLGFYPDN